MDKLDYSILRIITLMLNFFVSKFLLNRILSLLQKIQIKKRWFFFNNTNPIIGKRHDFIVSKTGTTNAAGGCGGEWGWGGRL